MCGIAAYSGKGNFNLDKIKLLLTYNTLERGDDSLGFYSPNNGLYKKAGKPVDLIPKSNIKEDNYFIGHVRAGTVGAKTDKNAHPFQFEELIGVMNGTTTNHWALTVKYGLKPVDYNVDSEAIFAIIQNQKNFKVLGELAGGCAIVVADTKNPNILYAYRNNDRPLYRGNLNDGMYISSIKESLEIIGCEKVQEFKPNSVYTIINGEVTNNTSIKIDTYNVKSEVDISGKVKVSYNQIENKMFVNRYVRFDSPNWSPAYLVDGFEDGKWYFCRDYVKANLYEICVKNNKNKIITLSQRAFSMMLSFPVEGDPMKTTKNIEYGRRNKVVIKEGETVNFIRYNKDSVEIEYNKQVWLLAFTSIRPLDYREILDYKEKKLLEKTPPAIEQPLNNIDSENDFATTEYQGDIVTEATHGPVSWLQQLADFNKNKDKTKQLSLLPSAIPTTEAETINKIVENLDDEFVTITFKEFNNLLDNIQFANDNMLIDVNKQVMYPKIKTEFTQILNEVKKYIKDAKEQYTTI